jgi:PAS domain S-box-containing protein
MKFGYECNGCEGCELLHDSQEKIRAVFESSVDCILVWDREYNYLYANQVAIDHVGVSRDKVIGKNIREGLGHVPDFMNLWMKRVDTVFETCKPMSVEDADYVGNKLVYSQSVLSPIKNSSGKIFAVSVVYRDITEKMELQKKVHEDLKASEQRFKRLSEASFEAIAVHKDGKIIDVNQKFIDMFGYTQDELKHVHGIDLIAPQSRETVKNNIASGYEVLYEVMGVKKDGTIFPIEIHSKNSQLDGQSIRIGAIQDLTKRKEMERQIVEMAEKYKDLYNNALIPLYRTRLSDGKVVECNEKLAELFGYPSREECLKTHYSTKTYADPEQREKLIERLKEHGQVEEFDIQTHKLDGSLLWVKVSAKLNSEGTYIEGAMHDITASKILTEAELAVLRLVLQGKANKDIADELKRSVRTIEVHRSHIMHRMGVNNLVELAKEAVKLGLG